MLSYLLSPRISVDPHALRDPKRFIPSHVKGILIFPESVENCLRPLDDAIINGIQLFLNHFTLILAQLVSGFYSVEFIAMIPCLLLYLGWDRAMLPVLSQSCVLLVLSQIPKRFIWRHRPYMVSRAKMGSGDRTSSFPARTVSCGVVLTYIMAIVYRNQSNPDDVLLVLYYAITTMAFILVVIFTSVCRIVLGAHYPSDCFVGAIQGTVSCFLGDFVLFIVSCPKQLLTAKDVTPWSWSNFNHFHFLSWTLIGLILVLVMGLTPFLLWPKAPIIAGLLFPSLVFSGLICPTKTNEDVVHILGKVEVFFVQDFIILGFIIGSALMAYRYVKPRKLWINIGFFISVYSCLLLVLMLQRLAKEQQDEVTQEGEVVENTNP